MKKENNCQTVSKMKKENKCQTASKMKKENNCQTASMSRDRKERSRILTQPWAAMGPASLL